MKTEARTGFTKKNIPIGNHFALLYDNDDERCEILAKFLKIGLEDNEKIIYLVDNDDTTEIVEKMKKRGLDLSNSNRVLLDTAEHGYCPSGTFSTEDMLEITKRFSDSALEEGFSSARGSGEMTWAFNHFTESKTLMTYEALLTDLLLKTKYIAVCQYDTRRFTGQTIMDILRTHPYVITKGKLIQNPYYLPANIFLKIVSSHPL